MQISRPSILSLFKLPPLSWQPLLTVELCVYLLACYCKRDCLFCCLLISLNHHRPTTFQVIQSLLLSLFTLFFSYLLTCVLVEGHWFTTFCSFRLYSKLIQLHVSVCVCSTMFTSLRLNGLWPVKTPLCMGFSRQEYGGGLPFPSPGDLPDPGIEPSSRVCCLGRHVLYQLSHLENPVTHIYVYSSSDSFPFLGYNKILNVVPSAIE